MLPSANNNDDDSNNSHAGNTGVLRLAWLTHMLAQTLLATRKRQLSLASHAYILKLAPYLPVVSAAEKLTGSQ